MIHMTNKRSLLLGLAIIALSNAVALGGAAYNRSGVPTSQPTLTERELGLSYNYGFAAENSGLSLQLHWRVLDDKNTTAYYSYWSPTKWLDTDKLASLGFDVSYSLDKPDSANHYQKAINREVFLVLENDGAAYQKVLQQKQAKLTEAQALLQQNPDKDEFTKRLKRTTDELEVEQKENSRLFVIDAGLDYAELRQKYSDNKQYLIVRGLVDLRYSGTYNKSPYLQGAIKQLSVTRVNVPLQHAAVLAPLLVDRTYRRGRKLPPRYEVSLKYGLRYEPWIVSVKGL